MSQDNLIKLECTGCNRITYHSKKNKKKLKGRLELSKYCKHAECKGHKLHKETK